jgi:hypothetical protein
MPQTGEAASETTRAAPLREWCGRSKASESKLVEARSEASCLAAL